MEGRGPRQALVNPATEEPLAARRGRRLDRAAALEFARATGGAALRALTFAERGALLKAACATRSRPIATSCSTWRWRTAATRAPTPSSTWTARSSRWPRTRRSAGSWARGRCWRTARGSRLGRNPRFHGQHVSVPRQGVAVHINAFNFPAWGLAEKAAVAWLAGMPVVCQARHQLRAGRAPHRGDPRGRSVLPPGAFSLLGGERRRPPRPPGAVGRRGLHGLERHGIEDPRPWPSVIRNSVRVNVEADSLNAAVLGPDGGPDTETTTTS